MNRVALVTCLSFCAASVAAALPPLREVKEINAGLIDVQIADIIRNECPSIEGRVFKGLMYFQALYEDARKMGYSHEEVKTFVDDPVEKKRVRDAAWAYMAKRGGSAKNTASLCKIGMAEIEQQSRVGSFLKAR